MAELSRAEMGDELARERAEYDLRIGWAEQVGVDVSRVSGGTMIERVIDAEQARWQQAIDKIVLEMDPDRDGSGCDSGDPLDLTLAELGAAWRKQQEHISTLQTSLADARRALAAEKAAHRCASPGSNESCGGCCECQMMQASYHQQKAEQERDAARAALTETLGSLHIIDSEAALLVNFASDPNLRPTERAQAIRAKRLEAHHRIVDALSMVSAASAPAAGGGRES